MKKISMGLLFILLLITIQPRAQEIKIRYERDDKGNIRFIADNSTLRPYFVVIEFSGLTGSMTITPGEVLRIKPGEKQLFTIKKVQDAPLFSSYKYKYYTSDPSAKINPDYPYLIPVKVGVKVRTIPVRYISTIIGKGTATNLYSISFQINDKDTICASRGGIVVETKDNEVAKDVSYNRDENFISILHDDGTVACYSGFEINQVFPKIGDQVIASQPLGIVAPGNSYKVPFVNLMVYYAAIDEKKVICVLTKFCSSGIKPEILLPNNKYTAHHYPEVVTIGMSRNMKKKYLGE